MEIKVIGTGSSGNCYLVSDGSSKILIECGLPMKKIKEGVEFNLSNVAGCLISHSHL